MADQEKHPDELLDSLLASYSDVQPRPGFETRLLAGLRESRPRFQFLWWWAGAVATIATAAAFAIYLSRPGELPKAPAIQAARPPMLPPVQRVAPPETDRHRPKLRVEFAPAVAQASVRQEVFPTPTPLSEQERLLLRYLAGTPRDEVASHAREDEPTEKVEPLLPESQHVNKTEVFSTR